MDLLIDLIIQNANKLKIIISIIALKNIVRMFIYAS
jgi:hypothetical protein